MPAATARGNAGSTGYAAFTINLVLSRRDRMALWRFWRDSKVSRRGIPHQGGQYQLTERRGALCRLWGKSCTLAAGAVHWSKSAR